MLFCWRPVVGPNAFDVPMPVSNRISLSPLFTIGEFCSSTTLSGIEEVVGEHLPHFFLRHADEGAVGIAERQRAVGDHGHFGVAEHEAVPVGRLRAEFRRLGQRAAAEKGRSAQTGAKRKQRPSRNVHRHTSSSTVFMNCSMLPGRIHPQLQAAPASRNWQVGGDGRGEMRKRDDRRRAILRRASSRWYPRFSRRHPGR